MNNKLISGGAKGADFKFSQEANKNNHETLIYTFTNHSGFFNDFDEKLFISSNFELDEKLNHTQKTLRRKKTYNDYIYKILLRDIQIGIDVDRIYAVGFFEENKKSRLGIAGGTAYAIQSYVNEGKSEVYFYDQNYKQWFELKNRKWENIKKPPKPYGVYGGIGSREITENGLTVIENLYK